MHLIPYIIISAAVCMGLLWMLWIIQIGIWRGTVAALCRVGWTFPVFLGFFPESTAEKLPNVVALKPLHILLDDSESMADKRNLIEGVLSDLQNRCGRLGCALRTVKLSELNKATQAGYSPLNEGLEAWLFGLGSEPWLLFSDGGDWHPTLRWSDQLRGLGVQSENNIKRGLILDYSDDRERNLWVTTVDVPPFSFQDQPIQIHVGLARSRAMSGSFRAQLQIGVGDKTVGSINAEFTDEDQEIEVSLTIPPLEKGQHLLSVTAVPLGGETALWDNNRFVQMEVLPNTVGVLHLLGAPSWDGRFLRRFLKAEPKYDLISFFILRDPWDSQQVNERELSLIPFPTKRLFEDELPNFRVVVIQNFALFQFLEQSYQENLVKFVNDGGSMLFLGGPRALQSGDISSSALSSVLPFHAKPNSRNDLSQFSMPFSGFNRTTIDKSGPFYDPDRSFSIELARPDQAARSLANVIDEWDMIGDELAEVQNVQGLHHMENVKFKDGEYTPLLYARTTDGARVPLAVASYPGKGRAIWIFTDSLWRLAMQAGAKVPRQTYFRFLQATMQWLMREEIRQSLVAKNFLLRGGAQGAINWQVELHGPATKYFRRDDKWAFSLCGQKIALDQLSYERTGVFEVLVSGQLQLNLAGGQRCRLQVNADNAAFGSVHTEISEVFPRTYSDSEVGGSRLKLSELSNLTGANLVGHSDPRVANEVDQWLSSVTGTEGIGVPSRIKSNRNFFWVLGRWWFWVLMLFIPLEVIVRRWHHLSGLTFKLRSSPVSKVKT